MQDVVTCPPISSCAGTTDHHVAGAAMIGRKPSSLHYYLIQLLDYEFSITKLDLAQGFLLQNYHDHA
jgi:hypothetical protein